MKPTREFSANVGDYSTGNAGADAIENDLDKINRMFDPLTEHTLNVPGGIGTENIQNGAVTDDIIGNRAIDENTATTYGNSGKVAQILSWFAKSLKALKGTANWHTDPPDTLTGLHNRVTTNATNISNVAATISSNKTDIETKLNALAGAGRTTETVKGNTDQIANAITSINNLQTQINNLNNTFATDAELANKVAEINAAWDSADDTIKALIDGKAALSHTHTKANITDFAHSHVGANEITDWNTKANATHTHVKADVIDLVLGDYYTKTELDGMILNNAGYHEEVFTATAGQTDFTLTESTYETGKNRIRIFVQGSRLSENEIQELDNAHVRIPACVGGEEVIIEYVTDTSILNYEYVRGDYRLTVGSIQPINPTINDIWIEV